jgi:hypothetical protein
MRLPQSLSLCLLVLMTAFCLAGVEFPQLQAAELLPADKQIQEAVDHYVQSKLEADKVTPAEQAPDHVFLRRVTLDLAGRIPTAAELTGYLAATEPDKKVKVIDRLLSSPDYAFQQRNELDMMLMEKSNDGAWREYMLKAAQENRPWDQLFKEMFLTSDDDQEKKAALMFVKSRVRDIDDLTNDTSRLFFGVSINCAKCHDHPLVLDWHQDHYYGMYAFFNRSYMNKRNQLAERSEGPVKFKTTAGEEKQAKLMFLTGSIVDEPLAPMLTEEEKKELNRKQKEDDEKKEGPAPPPPSFSARSRMVEMALKAEENRFFSRNIINRVWARLLGRGLVMPLDQLHSENPPSHPELMDWLARDLVTHGYDLKRLVRGIVLSQTYSRSSDWTSTESKPDAKSFALAMPRPLTPRQYSLSLLVATRTDKALPVDITSPEWANRRKEFENHSQHLANQLENPGDNFQVGVNEALFFNNNQHVQNDLLNEGGDRLLGLVKTIPDRSEQLKTVYQNVFSRQPDPEEVTAINQYLESRADRLNAGWQQVVWSMLTSSESRFNY